MKRYLSFIVVLIMFSSFISSCAKKEITPQNPSTETPSSAPIDITLSNDNINIAYEKLDDAGKQLYLQIVKKIQAYEKEFVFNNLQPEQIIKSYVAVIADHPEFFWLSSGYSYRSETLGNNITVYFTPAQSSRIHNAASDVLLLNKVVNSVVSKANQFSTDYDKVLFVHDYIVNNTTYDQKTYNLISKESTTETIYDATTSYGCLVGKNAVCSGYSAAFMLIMQKLGICCARVSGSDLHGNSHEWNYIFLDGEYYFVDVTWDDPVMQDNKQTLLHDYLLIDENELLMSHKINPDQIYPHCNGKTLNYHRKNGRYLEHYDFETYKTIVDSNIDNGAVDVKFSSIAEQKKAYTDLFEKEHIFDIANFANGVTYSTSSSGLILTVQYS